MENKNIHVQNYIEALRDKAKAEIKFGLAKSVLLMHFTNKDNWKQFLIQHGLDASENDFSFDDEIDINIDGSESSIVISVLTRGAFPSEDKHYSTNWFNISEFYNFIDDGTN